MSKVIVSFTTLDNVHKHPCWYYNTKLMGLKQPENEYMAKGKKAHEEFANKIKNKEKLLFDLDFETPEVHFKRSYDDMFTLHGWADAVNYKSKTLLELKTVNSNVWTNARVDKTMQPSYYSWISGFRKVFILSCKFDFSEAKLYFREYLDNDWKKAEDWAVEGLNIIKNTDWSKITCDGTCPFGQECLIFKRS